MIATEELRDARLTDLLEATGGALTDGPSLPDLAEDERAELIAASEARALLAGLEHQAPPRDFVRRTQRRLRRRSGGAYFHPVAKVGGYKLSVEIFAVVAVVVMAACWLFLEAERRAANPGQLTEVSPLVPVSAPNHP